MSSIEIPYDGIRRSTSVGDISFIANVSKTSPRYDQLPALRSTIYLHNGEERNCRLTISEIMTEISNQIPSAKCTFGVKFQ